MTTTTMLILVFGRELTSSEDSMTSMPLEPLDITSCPLFSVTHNVQMRHFKIHHTALECSTKGLLIQLLYNDSCSFRLNGLSRKCGGHPAKTRHKVTSDHLGTCSALFRVQMFPSISMDTHGLSLKYTSITFKKLTHLPYSCPVIWQ